MSQELELGLRAVGTRVRLFSPVDGRLIPNETDLRARAQVADSLTIDLAEERKAREKSERKAKREKKKAEAERQIAEAERQKAESLASEVTRLRALLGERGRDEPGE